MKLMICAFAFALTAFPISSVSAETFYLSDPATPAVESMSFAECTDVIQNYVGTFGTPRVMLEVPMLRIVQFDVRDQTEQVACDGESNLMAVSEIGND